MGSIAEENLWYKGKGEILREYRKGTAAILNAVAARNFSEMPGFAIEAFTDVEIDSKWKLTEYNQKIMGEAIDRELKALGLENDLALKQAMMEWETEKATLMSDLQKEFADKELIRSLRGEEIDALLIDQEIREVAIVLAKAAIDKEIEALKQQKEELGMLTLPYEEQLAAARLATAIKKAEIIPYILAALEAQSQAIEAEESQILPARTEKATYEKEIADKMTSVILPLMEAKASAITALTAAQANLISPTKAKAAAAIDLANEMMAQLNNHIALATEKVAYANAKVDRFTEELNVARKENELEAKKIEVQIARAGLEVARAEAKVAIATALRTQLGEIKTAMENEASAEITYINKDGANDVAMKQSRIDVEKAKLDAQKADIGFQIAAENQSGSDTYNHRINMANNAATAAITQKLVHLLA